MELKYHVKGKELYLLRINSNNPQVIKFYNKYCLILRNVITEAKKNAN